MENFISCAVNDDDDDEWLYHCETIVRDPNHRKFLKRASTIWTSTEPEFRPCWKNLCSSDNNYTIQFSFSKWYKMVMLN